MADRTDDERRAERAFIEERLAELRRELRESELAYGEKITEQNVDRIANEVIDALQRSGNGPLADDFRAKWEQLQGLQSRLNDDPANGTLLETYNAAVEDFERVNAAATAWLNPTNQNGR